MRREWGEMTTEDFAGLAEQRPVAAVVLGAVEQHGPHLPMATDCIIGEGLLDAASRRLAPDWPLLVLPAMAVGASDEHAAFAGTLSLTASQAAEQLVALGRGAAAAGVERLVLVNAHGGNIGWMNAAALALRQRQAMLVVKASYMHFEAPHELLGAEELRDGLHGGLAETAMMRYLAPDLVRMDRADRFESRHPRRGRLAPEGEASWAWLAEDLNPAGVVGDAGAATPELGRALVDHYARRLADIIEAARDLAWPPAPQPGS